MVSKQFAYLMSIFVLSVTLLGCQVQHQANDDMTVTDSAVTSGQITQTLTPVGMDIGNQIISHEDFAIYLSVAYAGEQGGSQIWKLNESAPYIAYEQVDLPANTALVPDNVRRRIQDLLDQLQYPTTIINDVKFDINLLGLELSPNKSKLAFVESYLWFAPFPSAFNGLVCFNRVVVLSLEDNSILSEITTKSCDNKLYWFPNGESLIYTDFENGDLKFWVLHVSSNQVRLAIEEEKSLLTTSYDGQIIAQPIELSPSRWGIKVFNTEANISSILEYIWVSMPNFDWKPNSHVLTIAGPLVPGSAYEALSIDVDTLEAKRLTTQPLLSFFDTPQWSPNGEMLAVNASELGNPINHLLIFDQEGKLLSDFVEERDQWQIWKWSSNSRHILILLGNVPDIREGIGVLDPFTGEIQEVPLPTEVQNGVHDRKTTLNSITW